MLPTMSALREHIEQRNKGWLFPETVEVKEYSGGDERIGWHRTCIVTATWADGVTAPVGFTDMMPEPE